MCAGFGMSAHIYRRIENAEGYVLIAVYLFLSLFVCALFP